MIFFNAHIFPFDDPRRTAVIARDGRIFFAGSDADALKLRARGEETLDLRKNFLYPGFTDAHVHLSGMAMKHAALQLHGCRTAQSVALAVREWIAAHGADDWVTGMGWSEELWTGAQFIHHSMLDVVAPQTPVYLTRIDGHAAWVNGAALRIAGITRETRLEGGEIVRDGAGEPSGLLVDNAMALAARCIPARAQRQMLRLLRAAIRELHSFGVTCVHDMDADPAAPALYNDALRDSPLRISAWLRGQEYEWRQFDRRGFLGNDLLRVDGVKFYADGALGSRGALLREPYDDDPSTRGICLLDEPRLKERMVAAGSDGYSCAIHAIGDAANALALDAVASARERLPGKICFRIEHAELAAGDIQRFAENGVYCSIQPAQRASDATWIERRIGERSQRAFPLRSMIDAGVLLIGGSDAPIESADPLAGILAASANGEEGERFPYDKNQAISRRDAIRLFTEWGGRTTSFRSMIGECGEGRFADFVVLEKDIIRCDKMIIGSLKPVKTVVQGEVVYESDG